MQAFIPYILIVILLAFYLGMVPVLVLAERKISAWIQYRYGPNRVGPGGLLQPIADAIKFFSKEDVIPRHVNKWLYIFAPVVMVVPAFFVFGVIPWGVLTIAGEDVLLQIGQTNIGILYVLAVTSLGVYSVTFGAWASNNKYALLGGLRAAAQMISYELAMGISIIGMIMIVGSLNLADIVQFQANSYWGIILQPLGALMFIVTAYAETNRLPFDLPETETELVGGYHTEYSSMKFAMFFMGEYCNMITGSAMIAIMFFGGWHVPFLESFDLDIQTRQLVQIGAFVLKVLFFLFLFIWVRWTLPRFRFDQLMDLGWKVLIPLALLNLVGTAVVLMFI